MCEQLTAKSKDAGVVRLAFKRTTLHNRKRRGAAVFSACRLGHRSTCTHYKPDLAAPVSVFIYHSNTCFSLGCTDDSWFQVQTHLSQRSLYNAANFCSFLSYFCVYFAGLYNIVLLTTSGTPTHLLALDVMFFPSK